MLTGIVRVHHVLSTAIDGGAVILNALLFYLILNHSNFQMKQFKWLFMLTCVGDWVLSAICLFSQPFLVFGNGFMFLTSNGPFCCRWETLDHVAMTVFCVWLHIQIVVVVLQYIWRYSLILGDFAIIKVTKEKLILPVLFCGIQAVTAVYCWNINQDGLREDGLEVLRSYGWEFTNETAPYPAMTPVKGFKTMAHNIFYMTSPVIGYAIIFSCHIGVTRFLARYGPSSNDATRRANSEVNRALIALALTPLVSLVTTATMIGSEWLEIPVGLHLSAFLSLGMTLLTFTNPLVAMIFVGPYRQGLLKLIGIRSKAPVTPDATADSVLSTIG